MFNFMDELKKALQFASLSLIAWYVGYTISKSIQTGNYSLFHVKELFVSSQSISLLISLFMSVIVGRMLFAYAAYKDSSKAD